MTQKDNLILQLKIALNNVYSALEDNDRLIIWLKEKDGIIVRPQQSLHLSNKNEIESMLLVTEERKTFK